MKAPILTLFFSVALLSTAQAQVKQTRAVASFEAVDVSGGIDLVLTPGSATAVVVDAATETQPHIQTAVRNGHLVIGWEQGFKKEAYTRGQREVHVYVTCPRLTGLSASGGTSTHTTAAFTTDTFALDVSSGSTATLALAAQQLTSSTSSGSTTTLSGSAARQRVTVSSGASYHAFALQSTTAEVETSSGSTAEVTAVGELAATASSGSSVRYKGAARVRSSKTSSGASIRKA